jgi:DNA-binding NarL/FixJ family response regulator
MGATLTLRARESDSLSPLGLRLRYKCVLPIGLLTFEYLKKNDHNILRRISMRFNSSTPSLFNTEQTQTFIIIDDQPLAALGLQAILQSIEPEARIFIAPSYDDGELLIDEKLVEGRIDMILASIDFGGASNGASPISAIHQLHRKYPYICLAVTGQDPLSNSEANSNTVLKCLEAGAVGYVPKSSSINIAKDAFKSVLSGNVYIPPAVMEQASASSESNLTHELAGSNNPFSGLVSLSSRQYLRSLSAATKPSFKVVSSRPSLPIPLKAEPKPNTITGFEIGLTDRQVDVLDLILIGLSNKRICRELNLAEGTVKVHVSAVLRALGARTRTEAVVAAGNLGLKTRIGH